jgi:CheY-like chemotaxis protein
MKEPKKPGLQILVVDDEPTVLDSIRMVLSHLGHTVQTADSGAAALGLLTPDRFNLVITDYFMNGMKGDELATVIKQRQPGLPIIMATAYADELKADGRLKGQVDYLLIKPFSMAELMAAIDQVTAGR